MNTFKTPSLTQIEDDISSLARAYTLFSRCHRNLLDHLLLAENNSLIAEALSPEKEPEIRDKYMLELNQKVYAAVTSMKALVGVANLLEERYEDTELFRIYSVKNSQIIENPSFNFWRKFRNYLIHEDEATWIKRNTEYKWQTRCKILLDSSVLLQHDWRKNGANSPKDEPTIEYITRYKAGIYLRNIISNYEKEMSLLWKNIFVEMDKIKNAKIIESDDTND